MVLAAVLHMFRLLSARVELFIVEVASSERAGSLRVLVAVRALRVVVRVAVRALDVVVRALGVVVLALAGVRGVRVGGVAFAVVALAGALHVVVADGGGLDLVNPADVEVVESTRVVKLLGVGVEVGVAQELVCAMRVKVIHAVLGLAVVLTCVPRVGVEAGVALELVWAIPMRVTVNVTAVLFTLVLSVVVALRSSVLVRLVLSSNLEPASYLKQAVFRTCQ